jgi:hypothetical protein
MSAKKRKTTKKSISLKKEVTEEVQISKWKPSTYDIIFSICLGLIILAIYLLRINFLDIPLERDEGDYALAGKLILEGAKPYVDVFEQKPPGLFYSYALVASLFGTTVAGFKMGFMVVNMLTVALIALGIRLLINPLAGIVGAATFAILSLNPYASGYAIQAEHLLIFFVSIAFFSLCYYYKKGYFYLLILAGASVAWSATIKQNGIFFILALTIGVLAIHLAKGRVNLRKLVKEYLYFGGGGIGMAVFVLTLMALQGVWKEFLFWSITFPNDFYMFSIPFERGMSFLSNMHGKISGFSPWFWYAIYASTLLLFLSRLKLSIKVWILVFMALSFFSIWPGYRFYGHYWIQLFFGASLGMAALSYALQTIIALKAPKSVGFAIPLIIFILIASLQFSKNKNYYLTPSPEGLMNGIYGDNPFMESRKIAEFINSKNPDRENDKLLVLGSEPQILLETGLKSPTPHTFLMFVTSVLPVAAVWREEYLEMLRKNEAKYAVFVGHPISWLANTDESRKFVGEIYTHLSNYYKVIGIADMISVEQTIYKWDEEAVNYRPQSEKVVFVFERK